MCKIDRAVGHLIAEICNIQLADRLGEDSPSSWNLYEVCKLLKDNFLDYEIMGALYLELADQQDFNLQKSGIL